jgi:hypothetical protein
MATLSKIFSNIQIALNKIIDVSLVSPANGEVLTYDASTNTWKNKTPASTGIVSLGAGLDKLKNYIDSTISIPPTGFLKYNQATSSWSTISSAAIYNGLNGISITDTSISIDTARVPVLAITPNSGLGLLNFNNSTAAWTFSTISDSGGFGSNKYLTRSTDGHTLFWTTANTAGNGISISDSAVISIDASKVPIFPTSITNSLIIWKYSTSDSNWSTIVIPEPSIEDAGKFLKFSGSTYVWGSATAVAASNINIYKLVYDGSTWTITKNGLIASGWFANLNSSTGVLTINHDLANKLPASTIVYKSDKTVAYFSTTGFSPIFTVNLITFNSFATNTLTSSASVSNPVTIQFQYENV